jgi:hypothetical protein
VVFGVVFAVVEAFAHGLGVVAVVLGVLAGAGVFWADLAFAPWVPCGRCNGSKTHGSFLGISGARGRCWKCKGAGQFPRFMVRYLLPGTYEDMKAGRKGRSF